MVIQSAQRSGRYAPLLVELKIACALTLVTSLTYCEPTRTNIIFKVNTVSLRTLLTGRGTFWLLRRHLFPQLELDPSAVVGV